MVPFWSETGFDSQNPPAGNFFFCCGGSSGRAIDCMSERLMVRIPLGTFFFFFAFKITQNYILLEAEGLENELCVSEVRTAPRFFKVRFTN